MNSRSRDVSPNNEDEIDREVYTQELDAHYEAEPPSKKTKKDDINAQKGC